MASLEENNGVTVEVKVKNEPICYSQSTSQTKEEKKVKEETIHMSQEVEIKAEEKFSSTEEFTNKISIAFLNEETNTTPSYHTPTTSKSESNKPQKKKTNKLKKSK